MDAVRYYIALVMVVGVPAALSMWFLIHPFARFWRRRGAAVTYLAVVAVAAPIGVGLFRLREPLLRAEYGFSWPLTLLAMVLCVGAGVLEHHYRRQLTIPTLLGLPEVSTKRPRRLLTGGVYGRIRHPRYVGLLLEGLGFSLIANYLAAYVVVAAMLPVLYLVVLLEERELLESFGEEYRRYMDEVPRFLPRRRPGGRGTGGP